MTSSELTPSKAAYRLTRVLNAFSLAHGISRFPVDVVTLAKEAAALFHWSDAITDVRAASIDRFEGALFPDEARQKWLLLYNDRLTSPGRIRFTQAHELGHYVLHRSLRESFQCTEGDMVAWSDDSANLEGQADLFAATLLMPLDDFRAQTSEHIDFSALRDCSNRYGVSLTAACLRWLEHTDQIAVLIVHSDGFINWAYSSKPAMRAGAFFRTRKNVLPVPDASIAANDLIQYEPVGVEIPASTWFPKAAPDLTLRELKLHADQYDWTMTLLVLPRSTNVWGPQEEARI